MFMEDVEDNVLSATDSDDESHIECLQFYPPVYIQRYALVKNILSKHSVESVVDFGSSNCKIVRWLKGVGSVRRIYLVDIDESVLCRGQAVVQPLNCERLCRRLTPLAITVLQGSAAHMDSRIAGCQAATLVEIIEHLEDDVLAEVRHCVFGKLRPSLVVISTPNSDFNVLFPDPSAFRHWDHKFEWSRKQFSTWCDDVCSRYCYCVEYAGVGDPPPGMSHVGFCSQVAIFSETAGISGDITRECVYKLIQEEVYPVEERSPAQRLADEVMHAVYSLHRYNGDVMSSSDGQITVSADAVSSSDGQITVSADAASSSDGQITVSVDAVSSSDGQITVPADAVSSSDGQITVSADAVSSSDGQITVSVDAVSSSDGQITVPADAVLRTVSRCCSCDSYTSEEIHSTIRSLFSLTDDGLHIILPNESDKSSNDDFDHSSTDLDSEGNPDDLLNQNRGKYNEDELW